MNDYAGAFEGVAKAALEVEKSFRKMSESFGKIKLTRAVRLHPSANPIHVPIWVKVEF